MNDDIKIIYEKLIAHETELINLRKGYIIVNDRYSKALNSLKDLTANASEAAKKACFAAEKAAFATKKCAHAAATAASTSVIEAAEAAEAVRMSNAAAESVRAFKNSNPVS